MEVDEITVPSPDFPDGLTFGPVTVESASESHGSAIDEVSVTLTPRCRRLFGTRWFPERYRTRGVFNVNKDRIRFRPTAPVLVERAPWWRRVGYRFLTRLGPEQRQVQAHSASDR